MPRKKKEEFQGAVPEGKDLWQGRDVCICQPFYKSVMPETHWCLMALFDRQTMRIEQRSGDMVVRSRNQLAKRFLASGAQWSFWIDDDMILPFGHAGIFKQMTKPAFDQIADSFCGIHAINRMVSHGKTIVGGCYWDRRGSGRLIAGSNHGIMNPIPSDALVPVNFVGTGCLLVHRQVFLDIGEKFPECKNEGGLGNEAGYFVEFMKDGRMWGEDESFAWRAAQCGHQTFLDLAVLCGHAGTNFHGPPKFNRAR